MPVFERQYNYQNKRPEAKPVHIPPAQVLQKIGPVLEVLIAPTPQMIQNVMESGETPPSAVSGLAIIDTGATVTAVDESICRNLGLKPTGAAKTSHAGGSEMRACYPIQITFPGTPLPSITNPRTMSVNLQFGQTPFALLLGRDVLMKLRFVYNGPAGRIEIAF